MVFGEYSQYYDTIYSAKNYSSEVAFVDKVIKKYSSKKSSRILSLGCGTCSHDILLAKKGYSITGIDQSASMLDIAQRKITAARLDSQFKLIKSDIRSFPVLEKHDIAMAMFNVIGYMTENTDLERCLKNISANLKSGGILFFDWWYLPAVLADKPTDRIKEIIIPQGKLIRLTKSVLHPDADTIDIYFHVLRFKKDHLESEIQELHTMRYWSLPEITYFLQNQGFKLLHACSFGDLAIPPSDKMWDAFLVAQKL